MIIALRHLMNFLLLLRPVLLSKKPVAHLPRLTVAAVAMHQSLEFWHLSLRPLSSGIWSKSNLSSSDLPASRVIAEEKRRMQTAVALAQSSQLNLAAMSGQLGTPAFKPTKETKVIVLDPAYPEHTVRIGAGLSEA